MRRPLLQRSLLALAAPLAVQLAFGLSTTHAQDAAAPAAQPEAAADAGAAPAPAPAEGEEPAAEPAPAEEPAAPAAEPGPGPVLEPPSLTPLELDAKAATPTPEAKPTPVAEKKGWKLPETVFHLHGYLRMRGGLLKDGALGHSAAFDRLAGADINGNPTNWNYDPFVYFYSSDARTADNNGEPTTDSKAEPVQDGCGDSAGDDGHCKKKTQVGGDLRFRLKPEIHLSDDIRIKAWIDLIDNVGLGTSGYGANSDFDLGRSTLRVRRAWGEARNRDIGEIRFGRMGADWGLGILDNGGDRYGLDSDFSSDVDRIMGMTNLGGFYFMAAYDWAGQGALLGPNRSPSGVPIDRAQRDDTDSVTAAIAHRLDPEVQRATLSRGESVFNYGLYFVWRKQLLKGRDANELRATGQGESAFYRLNQKQYIPDLWAQFLWEGLRLELEATYVAGSLEGGCPRLNDNNSGDPSVSEAKESLAIGVDGRSGGGQCKFRQLGIALEAEYRLYDDRLGIHFHAGLASGDKNAYGLAATNDPRFQRQPETGTADDGVREISTFQFHPDYRVDQILWRTVMRRVAGAYYLKPGISYDFIRDPYGQQAGARVDAIYSRAMAATQTWGRSANLGLELDLSLYYRSEDGPDLWDGFYTLVQFGILFPFQGLKYPDTYPDAPGKSNNAISFRGVMGIQF